MCQLDCTLPEGSSPREDGLALQESIEILQDQGLYLDSLRVRGFPFSDEIADFIAAHDQVFVVEQNRDAQMRTLLINELEIDPARLLPILHYDGTPITARFISGAIAAKLKPAAQQRLKEAV